MGEGRWKKGQILTFTWEGPGPSWHVIFDPPFVTLVHQDIDPGEDHPQPVFHLPMGLAELRRVVGDIPPMIEEYAETLLGPVIVARRQERWTDDQIAAHLVGKGFTGIDRHKIIRIADKFHRDNPAVERPLRKAGRPPKLPDRESQPDREAQPDRYICTPQDPTQG